MWMGGGGYTLAQSIGTLIGQLKAAYPSQAWQASLQTGTIGNADHAAQGSDSDHNPWLNNTVRALDVASRAEVLNGPDCEALFAMVNAMYAKHDPRVWPNGYAIYKQRITDWDNPGGYHAYTGNDPHIKHCHISVSQNPAGYNSTAPWPLTATSEEDDMFTDKDRATLDLINYQLQKQVAPAVGAIRVQVLAIAGKTAPTGGTVDPQELADDLAAALPADIAHQVVALLAQKLGTAPAAGQ